ncbi:specifically androgen-regulated gene protein [Brachionichthys hirsutus]|uniref:specifically androgen-regulated gene protein n=1 Tax=Brachionichthys hirsutus TaxID=412623 RepID=UPI0036053479
MSTGTKRPKSTWSGGVGLETMASTGGCDSVVSANSAFSNDSLEHLSAEEKACLVFLQETIESLDTEDDSGLSSEEPDQLPNPGNLATKLADLSASMSTSKLNRAKSGVFTCKNSSRPRFSPISEEPGRKHELKPFVSFRLDSKDPLEVNVIPPKHRDHSVKTLGGPLPRGPLSYDALVHLRRSASTKKTPLCPTIDHTIDSDNNRPVTMRALKPTSYSSQSQRCPPVVAPKPKRIPASIPLAASDTSYSIKNAADPQVIRMEALQKLGLLEDPQPANETVAPRPPPQFCPFLDTKIRRPAGGPANAYPLRIPSFSYTQVPSEPKNKHLQSSASFHHYCRCDHRSASTSHPSQPNGLKVAGPEGASTLDSHRNRGRCPEPQHIAATKPEKTSAAAQPAPHNPPNSVAYTVMVVPGMGADRKEALRKLRLLKY